MLVEHENQSKSDDKCSSDDDGILSDDASHLLSETLHISLDQPIFATIFLADRRMEIPENVSHQVKKSP